MNLFQKGVAQSIRSKDETAKKSLANTYSQIIELLLEASIKKTDMTISLRDNFRQNHLEIILEKFTSMDTACRSILQRHLKTSSRNEATDLAQHLQEILEEIRKSSSKLTVNK